MFKQLRFIYILLSVVFFISCSDDYMTDPSHEFMDSDVPVEIFAETSGIFTRGTEGAKKRFEPDDRIHVEITFYENSNDADADAAGNEDEVSLTETDSENKKYISRAYMMYKMDSNGKWQPMGSKKVYWPNKANKGVFRAYYVSSFTLNMEENDPEKLRLSYINDDEDPLYAIANVEWGAKVNLKFSHLCTHLTFTNLQPDIADYFWLFNKKEDIKNVFTLTLRSDNRIVRKFQSEVSEEDRNLIYVQHASENILEEETNQKIASKVGFYLAPGDYSNVELRTINNYSYISFQSEKTKDLRANVPYEIDITNNQGVTFVDDSNVWDYDDTVIELEPGEFLESITKGEEYNITDSEGKSKTILKVTPDGKGIMLCHNVSFKNRTDYEKLDVPTNRYFDGGNHYISDIATNLFATNHGTIKHLGLKNIRCNNVELWYESMERNYNRWGVLCQVNQGEIQDIRIEDSDIKVFIRNNSDSNQASVVYNVGSLTGSNLGTLSDVLYEGGVYIEAGLKPDPQGERNFKATINLGGFIGQSVNGIHDFNPVENSTNQKVTVNHNLSGTLGVIYMGGACGLTTADVWNISLPDVLIEGSANDTGLVSNVGGIVGRLRATGGSPSSLKSCTVKGTVKGYDVSLGGQLNAYSYTGGIAGYNYNYEVSDCRSLCSIYVSKNVSNDQNVTYGVGGGFGIIILPNTIKNNYIYSQVIEGPENYSGNFAGIAPEAMVWSKYQDGGNRVRSTLKNAGGEAINIGLNKDFAPPTDDITE